MNDFLSTLETSRATTQDLWAELKPYPFQDRYHLIRVYHRFVTWGLCEHFCQESARLTAIDAEGAIEAAELAVLISDLLKEERPGCSRQLYQLRGYAWAHDANARRVVGDLRSANESFSIADAWWEASEGAGSCLGYESLYLDFKASLRIAQRRFPEAFELLDRLFWLHTDGERAEDRDSHLAGRALVKKALALDEMNEPETAIAVLQKAEPLIDGQRDPRLLLCLRHNLVGDLASVGEYDQAASLLPQVEALCRDLGNPLDQIRLRWTEGRIAAGLGRSREAIEIFQSVRQEFAERGIAYDAALVTLDLTAVYAREGCLADVRNLSLEMAGIFRAQDVPREALAALLFFQKAAERERATAKLAREISVFLEKLRTEPELRFELAR
jgi:tetratricopeptide (TPR) repeat protein